MGLRHQFVQPAQARNDAIHRVLHATVKAARAQEGACGRDGDAARLALPCSAPSPTACGCRSTSIRGGSPPTWRRSRAAAGSRISSRQNYEGDWSVIPLRGPAGASHPIRMIYSDPGLQRFRRHALARRRALFPGGAGGFRLPLAGGAADAAHPRLGASRSTPTSTSAFEQGTVRIHIPVTTNDGVDFRLNGRALHHAGRLGLVPAAVRPAQRGQPGQQRPGPHGDRRQWSTTGWRPCSSGPGRPCPPERPGRREPGRARPAMAGFRWTLSHFSARAARL